jgi:putative protease
MGRVVSVDFNGLTVEPSEAHEIAPLKAGDGVVFDAADWRSPEEPEEGGRIFETLPRLDGMVELRFGNGAVRFQRIRKGDLVWRTSDPELERVTRPYTQATTPVHKQGVSVRVQAHEGAKLIAEWWVGDRHVTVESSTVLESAQNRGLSSDSLREQFGRLGNTAYRLADIEVEITGAPFAPVSLLNQLRREAVAKLEALQSSPRVVRVHDPLPMPKVAHVASGDGVPELHVLVRTPEQLTAALEFQPASITLDYLDLYGLRPSIERIRASGIPARVASPRVLKPGESRILNFLASLDCPIVVRSGGILEALRGTDHPPLIGDFSLNPANSLSAEAYLELGLERLTPTHDLNADQITELARKAGLERIEVIAYQHLPVFHTEHCVFCRFLSTGTSYRDCGRPCEKHRVALRDQSGRSHPLMADVGCRNTVFGAEAQEASAHLEEWRRVGIRHFRLEFVHESGVQVSRVYRAFESALHGRSTFPELARKLREIAPEGTTEGSLFVPSGYLNLPVLQ